jgi:hypothetical protein
MAAPAGYAEAAKETMDFAAEVSVPVAAMAKKRAAPHASVATTGHLAAIIPQGARSRTVTASFGGSADLSRVSAPAPMAFASSLAAPPPGPRPPRLDYTNLRMAPPDTDQRGTLIAAARDPRTQSLDADAGAQARQIAALGLPAGYVTDWPHTYDYAYASDGTIDVRADAAWHSVAVTAKPGTVKLRHVAVPREQTDVFRLAVIRNPLAGPLLPGPIDVYDRGNFLVTSHVDHTPVGASVEIGLGVDAQVKLARNTEFREEAAGMLRGALRLHHTIKIDVDNLSDREIDLEVRERIPVPRTGDDDVEVVAGKIEPAWERWSPDAQSPRELHLRGGYRWRVAVPAGGKRTLRAAYEVRIAGKHELIGGNRRES